jgi:hypothetical protein
MVEVWKVVEEGKKGANPGGFGECLTSRRCALRFLPV